jgi:Fic family protein
MLKPAPYRIEKRKRGENVYYYLIKDMYINGKNTRVAQYIGKEQPAPEDIERIIAQHTIELESKAGNKQAQIRLERLKTEYLSKENAEDIEKIRYFYQSINSLVSLDELKMYEQNFEEHYVHGTTAIEGNTLSLRETQELLEHGIIPKGKSLRDINEVQNYKRVAKFRNEYIGKVTLDFIKKLHEYIMMNILDDAGSFRATDGIIIVGRDYQLTPAIMIEDDLELLIDDYYTKIKDGHNPFECAVLFHYRFESIHPFRDGNGRVGRELLNYLLTTEGYPRVLVLAEERSEYLQALDAGDQDRFSDMVNVFAAMLITQRKEVLERNLQALPKLMRGREN